MIIEKIKASELREGDRITIKAKGTTKVQTITEVVKHPEQITVWMGLRRMSVRADSTIRVLRQGITTT